MQVMKFRNARFKLQESKYFLDRIRECYNDEIITNYYTNAFISSARSVADYIRQDFFDELNFKISNKELRDFSRSKQLKGTESDKKETIENFLKNHDEKYKEFLKKPFNYYFHQRRNTIIHRSGNRLGVHSLTTMTKDKKIIKINRFLESPDSIPVVMADPSKWIDFGRELSKSERYEYEHMFRFKDLFSLLEKFFKEITNFLEVYENEYSNFTWSDKNKK